MLEEVGRTAAPVPALAVMGLGGSALAHFGGLEDLEGVADGTRIVTCRARSSRSATRSFPRRRPTATAGSRARRCAFPRASTRSASSSPPTPGVFVIDPTGRRRDRRARGHHEWRARGAARPAGTRPPSKLAGRRRCHVAGGARAGGDVRDGGRRVRGRTRAHRELHEDPRAVRSTDRIVPGRQPARGRRVHRHRSGAAHGLAGGMATRYRLACRRTGRRSPSSGRARARSVSCTRRTISTVGWASIATTRSTATSCSRSSSSCHSVRRRRRCCGSVVCSPTRPSGNGSSATSAPDSRGRSRPSRRLRSPSVWSARW